ncbi:hypothetical protein CR513_25174, partial [Mucuna pruriens]
MENQKIESELNQDNFNLLQLNVKAKHIITCVLSKFEYNKFCSYKTTKGIFWIAFQKSKNLKAQSSKKV